MVPPNKSGRSGSIILISILIVLIVAAGGFYYYKSLDEETQDIEPTSAPVTGPSKEQDEDLTEDEGEDSTEDEVKTTEKKYTLTITENGATFVENYQIMPRREKYLQTPNIVDCYAQGATPPSYCNLHNRETQGQVIVYDLNASGLNYNECLGGGHDCWYVERFSQDGTLIDFSDKNGVKLLDKMADDLWSNKWDMDGQFVSEIKEMAEFKDNKLVAKRLTPTPDGRNIAVGEQLRVADFVSPSVYYLLLLMSLRIAGKPKPDTIVLRVRGGKEMFDNFVQLRSNAYQSGGPTQ